MGKPRGDRMITHGPNQRRPMLQTILGRWWLIVGMALVGAITAYVIAQQVTPVYESSSEQIVTVNPAVEDPSDVASALSVLRNRQITATYAEILQSQKLLDRSLRELAVAPGQYSSRSNVLPESNVVSLVVSGPDAEVVQELNSTIGAAAQSELAAIYPIYVSILLESPKTPTDPAAPSPIRDAVFGGAIGAFLGLILATLWPSADSTIAEPVGIDRPWQRDQAKAGGES